MPTPKIKRPKYTRPVRSQGAPGEPSDYPSPITPAGVVQGYGNIFRAMRSQSGARRLMAIAFTLLVLFPMFVIVVGYSMMLLHAL